MTHQQGIASRPNESRRGLVWSGEAVEEEEWVEGEEERRICVR